MPTHPHPWPAPGSAAQDPDPSVDREHLRTAWALGGESAARAVLSASSRGRCGDVVRRWRQRVHVSGCDTLAPALRDAVSAAGLPLTERETPDSASLFVGRISPLTIHEWTARRRVHLVVSPRASSMRIGPLVVPGHSACLRCLHLARTDRDAAWPRTSEALRHAAWPRPDPQLVHRAAGLAAFALTRWAESGRSPLLDHLWTLDLDEPSPWTRRVARHPLCGCWWPTLALD